MTIAVLRRTRGFAIDIDGRTTELDDDQAHDLTAALTEALKPSRPRAVTPAKARLAATR